MTAFYFIVQDYGLQVLLVIYQKIIQVGNVKVLLKELFFIFIIFMENLIFSLLLPSYFEFKDEITKPKFSVRIFKSAHL